MSAVSFAAKSVDPPISDMRSNAANVETCQSRPIDPMRGMVGFILTA